MAKRQFDKLTAAQIVAIDKALSEHTTKTGPETCVYDEGWDDAVIARIAIPEYQSNGTASVGRLRIQLGYGKLRVGRPAADSVEDAYKDLERRVAAIERTLFA